MEEVSNGDGNRGEKRVCVTGASGFIASWIVKLLLQRGYTVHASVRSLYDPAKTKHLLELDGADTRLRLFEANLLEEGSFDSAIHGCSAVFHTASPVIMETENPQEEVVDPAVKGALNVLASCARTPSVKRVIFTSSSGAVVFTGRPITSDTIIDETWFSDLEVCEKFKYKGYVVAKTLAETSAWKFAKEKGIDMVVIVPELVIGPMLQPTLNWSTKVVLHLINGSETYQNMAYGWVHVKDVAEAHIRAFEIPSASGRYILSERVAHQSEVVKMLRELYPSLKLPDKCEDDQPLQPTYKISQDKVKSLGIEYIPLKVALKDTVESFKEKKLVSF